MSTWSYKSHTFRYGKHDTDLAIDASYKIALDTIMADGGTPTTSTLQPHGADVIVTIIYKQNI